MEPLLPDDPERIGPNELLARLGAGGMGQVYLARTRGGRPVAVKVIHENLAADREFRARFGREVTAARRVNGAFTAPLLDADPEASVPWLATAYLPGLSLTDAVAAHGPLPEAAARALGAALAEALDAIHRAGVVHRDLKPPNVLLTSVGPRVIDFGIARAADFATLTGTGVIVGTPGYLAPEQITGAEVGPPVDVFALGALLVYALIGVGPFGRGNSHELMLRSVTAEPSLGAVRDPALQAQLAACLDKAPDRRPAPSQLVAAWASAVPAQARVALDGTQWLPTPIAGAIDRAVAALPELTAAPWRVAPAEPPPPHRGAPLPSGRPALSLPLPLERPPTRLSRRALLGGAIATGVLGTTAAVLIRNRLAGTGGPVRWLLPADQAWVSSGPWLINGVLLGEDPEGRLESRSLADGSRRWTSSVEIGQGMALDDVAGVGVGFPGGGLQDGVVGVDLADGTQLWLQPMEPTTAFPPSPVDGAGRAVLVGRADRSAATVFAFGPRDGAQLWRTELAGGRAYGVTVAGEFAYATDDAGYAYGIDIGSGVVRWRVQVTERSGGAHSQPVAAGGRLYLADPDTLYALDVRTGQSLWTRTVDEGVAEGTSPMVVEDRIYLSAADGTLCALAAADGTVAWKAPVGSGGPVLAGPVACANTADELSGIALDSGRVLWRRPVSTEYATWPVLAGGLFHLADDDAVVSLEPSSGAVVRTVGEDAGVSGAHALDTDGSALYLKVFNDGPALCSLTLPDPRR